MRNDHRFHHAAAIRRIARVQHPGTPAGTGSRGATGHSGPVPRRAASAFMALACAWCVMATSAVLPSPAVAATPWRCGNAYSDTPCPGGRRIDVDTAPGDAARRAADEATSRIEHRADAMERDRLRNEQATAARNGAVILPDHRIAESQAREASRRTAERVARDEERRRNRNSNKGAGRRHAAVGDIGPRAAGTRHR